MIEDKNTVLSMIKCDGCGRDVSSYVDDPLPTCPHCTYDLESQRRKLGLYTQEQKQVEQKHNPCNFDSEPEV